MILGGIETVLAGDLEMWGIRHPKAKSPWISVYALAGEFGQADYAG